MSSFWSSEGRRPRQDEKADVAGWGEDSVPHRTKPDPLSKPQPDVCPDPTCLSSPPPASWKEHNPLGRSLWLSAGALGTGMEVVLGQQRQCSGGGLPAGVQRQMTLGSGEVKDLAPNSIESHGEKAVPLSITHQSRAN